MGRLPAGIDPRAAAVPDRRARLLLRRRGCAAAGCEPRLLDRAADVRGRLGPLLAAVADAGRARGRGRRARDGRADRELRGDVRGGRGERPRGRGVPSRGRALGQLRQPRAARAGHELVLARRQRRLRARAAAHDARGARVRPARHAAGADPAVARGGAAGLRSRPPARARAGRAAGRERPEGEDGPRRMGAVRAPRLGRRAALRRVLRAPGLRADLLRGRAEHERGGRQRRAERDADLRRGGDLRRRPARRPPRAAPDRRALDGHAVPAARRVPARRPLARDGPAGRDRLRGDRELQHHRRDGPGVPPEPARPRLGHHDGRRDRRRRPRRGGAGRARGPHEPLDDDVDDRAGPVARAPDRADAAADGDRPAAAAEARAEVEPQKVATPG